MSGEMQEEERGMRDPSISNQAQPPAQIDDAFDVETRQDTRSVEANLQRHGILDRGEDLTPENFDRAFALVEQNRQTLIDYYNANGVPAYMEDQVVRDQAGKVVDFDLLDRVVYTRIAGISRKKTETRMLEDYLKRSTAELASIWYGSDTKDGLTEEIMASARTGRIITDSNKASRARAVGQALIRMLEFAPTNLEVATQIIDHANEIDLIKYAKEWLSVERTSKESRLSDPAINEKLIAINVAIVSGNPANIRKSMKIYYNSYPQPSTRAHLTDVLKKEFPSPLV